MTNEAITTLVSGKLTVCTYGGFAPVCYKDEQGNLTGLDVIFLEKFAISQGLEIALIEHDFDGIWTMPDENKCDVAAAGVQKRDKRDAGPGGAWSDAYFQVQRSLLVRSADQAAFDDYLKLSGKSIVVTRGSTADIDAKTRYPHCSILYVDEVAEGQPDAQSYIVKTLIANHRADAFAEGDVSNQYLRSQFGKDVAGGLALADIHHIDGTTAETFNFITRNASTGLLEQLNLFIKQNKGSYVPVAQE
jgi:ABC-type amino acid transport substrate-binding protein